MAEKFIFVKRQNFGTFKFKLTTKLSDFEKVF